MVEYSCAKPEASLSRLPTADSCCALSVVCTKPYERTPEHLAKMSAALTGKRHSWSSGSTRPEVAGRRFESGGLLNERKLAVSSC